MTSLRRRGGGQAVSVPGEAAKLSIAAIAASSRAWRARRTSATGNLRAASSRRTPLFRAVWFDETQRVPSS